MGREAIDKIAALDYSEDSRLPRKADGMCGILKRQPEREGTDSMAKTLTPEKAAAQKQREAKELARKQPRGICGICW